MDAMSCLAPLPFFSGTAYADADAAITSALRFSSISSSADSSCFAPSHLFPALQPVLTTTSLVSHSSAARTPGNKNGKQQGNSSSSRLGLGAAAAGGRAGKRRARPSKRAPTTYIRTDPANFRLMVQHVTGAQLTADPTAVLLVDDVEAPVFGAGHPLLLPPTDDEVDAAAAALRHHHHQQQQYQQQRQQAEPCFPTLDSWSVMYESSELAAALIDH